MNAEDAENGEHHLEATPSLETVVNDVVATSIGTIPILRVEQLKDEVGSNYTSEEECYSGISDAETGQEKGNKRELGPFVEPTDELVEKIINQIEFYFSDANLLKDAFLLKHVKRNKQGYVSIKLITSFKKVKSLTKDYRQVAFSLHKSQQLSTNEEGTKVMRNLPLPDYDETTPSRTVVAMNLPFENPTIEQISGLFSKCGDISLVRIIRPGKVVPPDIKKHMNNHPHLGNEVCAVVEFDIHEHAKSACNMLTNKENWRSSLNVELLVEPKKKNSKKDQGSDNETVGDRKRNQRGQKGKKKNDRISALAQGNDSSCYSSGSEAEDDQPRKTRQNASNRKSVSPTPNRLTPTTIKFLSPKSSPQSSPHSSPSNSPLMRRRSGSHGKSPLTKSEQKGENGSGDSAPTSPWVQRRMQAAQDASPLAKDSSPYGSPLLGRRFDSPRVAVIRQPQGPDGTKGFNSLSSRT